jgi:DNA-directed RNA polymerase subunit RPC12/RpoP
MDELFDDYTMEDDDDEYGENYEIDLCPYCGEDLSQESTLTEDWGTEPQDTYCPECEEAIIVKPKTFIKYYIYTSERK